MEGYDTSIKPWGAGEEAAVLPLYEPCLREYLLAARKENRTALTAPAIAVCFPDKSAG